MPPHIFVEGIRNQETPLKRLTIGPYGITSSKYSRDTPQIGHFFGGSGPS